MRDDYVDIRNLTPAGKEWAKRLQASAQKHSSYRSVLFYGSWAEEAPQTMDDWTSEELEDFAKENIKRGMDIALDTFRVQRGLGHEWTKESILKEFLRDARFAYPEAFQTALEMDEKPAI